MVEGQKVHRSLCYSSLLNRPQLHTSSLTDLGGLGAPDKNTKDTLGLENEGLLKPTFVCPQPSTKNMRVSPGPGNVRASTSKDWRVQVLAREFGGLRETNKRSVSASVKTERQLGFRV